MSERRTLRLVVEVVFLAALAAALGFAHLRNYEIAGVMAVGWIIVAVFEWGALRSRPHYGSGSPPRWYTPRVKLPPPRPLEQLSAGYPAADAANDAPTWIASPAMLAEWPVADTEPEVETPADEQTHVHDVLEVERAVAVDEAPADELDFEEPEVEQADLEEAELEEPEAEETAPASAPPSAPPAPAPRPVVARTARHRVDPLVDAKAKGKRFARRREVAVGDAEVPDGPPPGRALPSQRRDED
jgi:hypothetical protein